MCASRPSTANLVVPARITTRLSPDRLQACVVLLLCANIGDCAIASDNCWTPTFETVQIKTIYTIAISQKPIVFFIFLNMRLTGACTVGATPPKIKVFYFLQFSFSCNYLSILNINYYLFIYLF